MIEFVLNLSVNGSTGFALFKLTYGYMPHINPFTVEGIKYPGVLAFAQCACANLEMAHDVIIKAHMSATFHANKHRSEETLYEEGRIDSQLKPPKTPSMQVGAEIYWTFSGEQSSP